jgi:hypothetical protein
MIGIFKIRRGKRGNCYPNDGGRLTGRLAARSAGRPRRGFAPVPGGFSCRRPQSRQAQQVVSPRHEVAPGLRPFQSPIPAPAKAAHRLDPSKYLLDTFTDAQADLITRLPGGAPVQSGHVHFLFARHMRRDHSFPAALHERFLMIALVGTHRLDRHAGMQLLMAVHLGQGHDRFALRNRVVQGEVGAQTVPVFHQGVRPKIQPRFLRAAFAIQHALRIGRAPVRVVAALFPAKVDRRIAGILVFGRPHLFRVAAILAHETLQARPGFDQRAVGGEGFVAGPAFLPAQVIDFHEEESGHVGGEHALVVLGKDAVVKAAFAKLAVQKPEPEQMVTELFAEETLAADAIKRRQHPRLEQLFGRNAVAPALGVEFIEERREFFQDGVHAAFDGAQRMLLGHALVEVDHRQKVRLGLGFSAHEFQTNIASASSNVFQQPASNGAVFSRRDADWESSLTLTFGPDFGEIWFPVDAPFYYVYPPEAYIAPSEWIHVVAIKSGTQYSFYTNGVAVASWTDSFELSGNQDDQIIGAQLVWPAYFGGSIDDVRFYNRALSDLEVQQLYQFESVGPPTPPTPPAITSQPQSLLVNAHDTTTFSATATGTDPLAYQWFQNGKMLTNANDSTLTLANVRPFNAGNYFVVIANGYGSVTSSVASLTMNANFANVPPPYLNVTLAVTLAEQNTSKLAGGITTTAAPLAVKLATADVLKFLALDEYAEGNWPSNSFPKTARLAVAGGHALVLNGTNFLLDASDILTLTNFPPGITYGKLNATTGLASPTIASQQTAALSFDDTFISGGKHCQFYLAGVLTQTRTDTTPLRGKYTETQTLSLPSGAGDGSLSGVPFICTGSFSATVSSALTP